MDETPARKRPHKSFETMPIGNTVYLFTRKQIGDDNELGRKLIRGFLTNLAKQEVLPS